MERIAVLKEISKKANSAANFWIFGIIIFMAGLLLFILRPTIVDASFNISSVADFNAQYQSKQNLSIALLYSSCGLMLLGGILSFLVGETIAGYAAFTAFKLKLIKNKNEETNFDYTGMAILSCFLLPFIFLYVFKSNVDKEIKYLSRKKETIQFEENNLNAPVFTNEEVQNEISFNTWNENETELKDNDDFSQEYEIVNDTNAFDLNQDIDQAPDNIYYDAKNNEIVEIIEVEQIPKSPKNKTNRKKSNKTNSNKGSKTTKSKQTKKQSKNNSKSNSNSSKAKKTSDNSKSLQEDKLDKLDVVNDK
ncbi:MAG: hypothetical protein HUJ42_03085 [Malacoplasma sp.]|nr:hypothetical protein [Malacoplasma sp.]